MQLSETIKNFPQLLSVEEAAAYLRMSVSWVNQTLRKFCPARKIGGRVRYLKDDLDRFIERSATFQIATHMNRSLVAIEVRNGKTIPHK
jgi:excisionase family DNA binding protein